MYKNIQNCHSPLSPLCPTEFKRSVNSNRLDYFTPSRPNVIQMMDSRRRTFTPSFNEITPPLISPIAKLNGTKGFDSSKDDSTLHNSSSGSSADGCGHDARQKLNKTVSTCSTLASGQLKTPINKMQRSLPNSAYIPRQSTRLTRMAMGKQKSQTPQVLPKKSLDYDSSASDSTPRATYTSIGKLNDTPIISLLSPTENNNSFLEKTFNVESILHEIGMEKYVEEFERQEIDVMVFLMLSADDLKELSIAEEDQHTILKAVKNFSRIFDEDYNRPSEVRMR